MTTKTKSNKAVLSEEERTKACAVSAMEAIVKMWIYPYNTEFFDSWIDEVKEAFKYDRFYDYRTKTDFTDSKITYQYMIDNEYWNDLWKLVIKITKKYPNLKQNDQRCKSLDVLKYKIDAYFIWVSEYLEENGILNSKKQVWLKLFQLEITSLLLKDGK